MGKLYAPSSSFFVFVPNPDLEPERSFSWDIGPTVSMNTCGVSANYFFTSYRDLIKADYPTEGSFTYINVNKAESSGLEANAWVAPISVCKLSPN
jgi:outer membrane cobalamin receptor